VTNPERRLALIIANGEYTDKRLRKLTAPVNDATSLAELLQDPEVGGFIHTEMLLNKGSSATLSAIERFLRDARHTDLTILYFSGHGVKDDLGRLFLTARNTRVDQLYSTSIPDILLKQMMDKCRAGKQVLILDCCFGGAFASKLAKGDFVDAQEVFSRAGKVVLTASNAMQFALDADDPASGSKLSPFTGAVVEGLHNGSADIDRDGQVSAYDLFQYVSDSLSKSGSPQRPTISSAGMEGKIFLARGRAWDPKASIRDWIQPRSQGGEGTMGPALAAVMAFEASLAKDGRPTVLSGRYMCQKAKELEKNAPDSDPGLRMESLARIITSFGCCPEEAWPTVPASGYMKPEFAKLVSLPEGKTWADLDALAKPYRAKAEPVTSVDAMRYHLECGHGIFAGVLVHKKNFTIRRPRGRLSPPPNMSHSAEIRVSPSSPSMTTCRAYGSAHPGGRRGIWVVLAG
jgi:hypothetical protein